MTEYKYLTCENKDSYAIICITASNLNSDFPNEEFGEELIAVLDEIPSKKVILDFSKIRYVCSSTLSRFIVLQTTASERRIELKFANINPLVSQIFRISGLYMLMDIKDTVEQAVEDFTD